MKGDGISKCPGVPGSILSTAYVFNKNAYSNVITRKKKGDSLDREQNQASNPQKDNLITTIGLLRRNCLKCKNSFFFFD